MFYGDQFLCQAVCAELAGKTFSLKEIIHARREHRRQVRKGITERLETVERYIGVHQPEPPLRYPDPPCSSPRLKRYINE